MERPLDTARTLDAEGLNVLPAKYGAKTPSLKEHKRFQTERTTNLLAAWFGSVKQSNFWIYTGLISSIVVLDLDGEPALRYWMERLGDQIERTTCVATAKGWHLYWRLQPGEIFDSWAYHKDDLHFDVHGEGKGVIAAGSTHESGAVYTWVRSMEHILPVPNALRKGGVPDTGSSAKSAPVLEAAPSTLAQILRSPATEGGRNVWLTQVAGHIAKHIPYQDAYEAILDMANDSLPDPLDTAELAKISQSIWGTEQRRDRATEPNGDNGWLCATGERLHTPTKVGENVTLSPWANFDLRVLGVIVDELERSYDVEVLVDGRRTRTLLTPDTLGRADRLNTWLHGMGAVINAPAGDLHKGRDGARLQLYLNSQDAPTSLTIPHLGWYEGVGFVTHEGLITPDGLEPLQGVLPHPRLKGWAPYRYGFVEQKIARQVLAEVLTFHEPQVCAVFGAWWAACFLKAQITEQTSLFPFMALEAPSESGKTTGFFSLMMQLNGNTEGHAEYTLPVLRDRASSHRNGIVWVDDMSRPEAVLDLLRQATSEGSRAKKGNDRTTQETVRLVAPVAISGEGIGALALEKALLDRAIRLQVGSPKSRMSLHDATRPQWDDIKDLLAHYGGDLTQVAGTMVQQALAQADRVSELRRLRTGTGRHADKLAILRLGARLLAEMSGCDWVIDEVDNWCGLTPDLGNENVLTTQMLPELLRSWGVVPRSAAGHVAAFLDVDGQIWYSEETLAGWWRTFARTDRERQLGSLESIKMQRQALELARRKRFSILDQRRRGETDQLRTYWSLGFELSATVLHRTGVHVVDGPAARGSTDQLPLADEEL